MSLQANESLETQFLSELFDNQRGLGFIAMTNYVKSSQIVPPLRNHVLRNSGPIF